MIGLWACFQAPGIAQTPSPGVTPTPAAVAKPGASAAPQAPVVGATPAAAAAATPYNPEVHLSPRSDTELLEQMKGAGTVGRSTFVDKLRRVIWSLAIICLLIYLLARVVSKGTLEKMGLPSEPDSLIEVLEKKKISPGRSIMLVRVGPKVLAVAATESGFRTLTEIDGELLKQHQDEAVEGKAETPISAQGPAEIAQHYLSIIPGFGGQPKR